MNKTEISWTDLTWNPVAGCSKVSPGCQNCYAEYLTVHRFHRPFDVKLRPERLKDVKNIPPGSKVFVNSMSDLFHEKVPLSYIRGVMEAIESRPDVIFQVLTKRPERVEEYQNWVAKNFSDGHHYSIWFPQNLWLGVSVEMKGFRDRISTLQYLKLNWQVIPGKIFVSFEPLLRDVTPVDLYGVDWIIIGGESGPNHRPFNPDWARNLIKQAKAQGVAVWMKQLGGFRPGNSMGELPEDLRIREFPETASPSNLTEAKQ